MSFDFQRRRTIRHFRTRYRCILVGQAQVAFVVLGNGAYAGSGVCFPDTRLPRLRRFGRFLGAVTPPTDGRLVPCLSAMASLILEARATKAGDGLATLRATCLLRTIKILLYESSDDGVLSAIRLLKRKQIRSYIVKKVLRQ
jgi:hypothetical protein